MTVFAEPLQKALEAVPPRSRGPVRKVIPFLGFGFPVREVVAFGGISRVVNIDCGVRKIVALGDSGSAVRMVVAAIGEGQR